MKKPLVLQLSLLTALGLLPFACADAGEDPEPSGAGSSGTGGTHAAGEAGEPGTVDRGGEGGVAQGGTGAGAGAAGAAGAHGLTRGCTNPQPSASGLVWCDGEGYYKRPEAVACAETKAGGQGGAGGESSLPRAPGGVECDEDADCTAYDRGYCSNSLHAAEINFLGGGGGAAPDFCRSGCVTDADCGEARICVCNGEKGGVCVASNCTTDADCGAGLLCASVDMGCGSLGFLCQSAADECGANADCENLDCAYGYPPESAGVRTCDATQCGRPFLVESAARVAPTVASDAWRSSLSPRTAHLTPAERDLQAAHWTKLGQMEHASIAAFARFQLQLLALGAPPELVQACNQALVDETAHTQLCFGLASAYAGRNIGPGPLDVSHSLDVTSLADIVDLVIAEGCIGETSAALEALEAAEVATDPVIRSAYERIAADEQRHAELAFRFVRWALVRDDEVVRGRVQVAVAASRTNRDAADVALPCLQALLASKARSSSTRGVYSATA